MAREESKFEVYWAGYKDKNLEHMGWCVKDQKTGEIHQCYEVNLVCGARSRSFSRIGGLHPNGYLEVTARYAYQTKNSAGQPIITLSNLEAVGEECDFQG